MDTAIILICVLSVGLLIVIAIANVEKPRKSYDGKKGSRGKSKSKVTVRKKKPDEKEN